MKRFRPAVLLLFTGILIALVLFGAQLKVRTAFAFPGGAGSFDPAAPTANACAASGCHTGTTSAVQPTITFPSGLTYKPGVAQHLTVMVNGTTFSTWGFQLTTRLASSTSSQAGSFTPGSNSNLGNDSGTVQGSSSSSSFAFDWTPPTSAAGNVNLYLSGLNTGSFGSNVFSNATFTLAPAVSATPDFSLSASPASLPITQGSNGSSMITVIPSGGFTGAVTFTAAGMPSGVTASFVSSTLTLAASATAATGTSNVTITGKSGSLSHTTTVSLTVNSVGVPNFSLSASPSSLTISPGSSGSSTITIAPSGGFNSSTVSFSPPGLPSGVTASFSPISTTGTSTLTLSASSAAASLTVGVTITGISGSLTHTTTVTLTVSAITSTGTLTTSPSSLTFNSQGGASMPPAQKLTLTTSGGPVSYSASSTGGPWLTTSPTGGSAPGTVTVSVNPTNMSAGSYSGMVHLTASGGNNRSVPVTLNIASQTDCGDGCGGNSKTMYAEPYVHDPNSSGTLTALWVNLLGMPTGKQSSTGDSGLVLSKNANAPAGSQTGALIRNVQGSLTELGFDYRDGGQCTATSPRFVVATSSGTHVVQGCNKATVPAPMMGWNRVLFKLTNPSVQTSTGILPGDAVSSITLVLDQGPGKDPATAGGLVVIDNININGTIVGKGSPTPTSTPTFAHRDD